MCVNYARDEGNGPSESAFKPLHAAAVKRRVVVSDEVKAMSMYLKQVRIREIVVKNALQGAMLYER
jgi:hypothetical protein